MQLERVLWPQSGSQGSCPCRWDNKGSGHNTPKKPSAPLPLHGSGGPAGRGFYERVGGGSLGALRGSTQRQPARHSGPRGRGGAPEAVSVLFSTPRHAGEGSVAEQLRLLELSCQLHSSRCHSYLQDFSLTRSITIQKSPWRKVSACWFVSLSFASSAGEGRKKAISNQLSCFPPFYISPLLLPSFCRGG